MRLTASALIGRDGERELVTGIVDRAVAGGGAAVAVVGDAGIGKSRLVAEILRRSSDRGCAVAVGRATAGLPIPFRPITEALLMLDRERNLRSSGAADWLPFLGRVVPAWVSKQDGGETTIPVIGASMLACFETVRGDGAVLLVVEDLHWADDETLSLIEFLADNVSASHVAVVATMRPEPGEAHRVFQRLEQRGNGFVVELPPLGHHDVSALVRNCLGGSVMPDVERFVDERCDGNPLFAEELLAGLQSSGSLAYDPDGWRVVAGFTTRVPVTLTEAVRDRVSALPADDRTVIGAAAVLGRRFDWRIVQAMTGASGDQVLAALRRAADVQLVEFRDGGHQFRHALTRDVIRDGVPDPDRRTLAAHALERLVDRTDLALVAELAEQAGDHEVALASLRAVAAQHVARGALASATSVLRRAELLAFEPVERLDVAIELASALLLAGDGDGARLACEAVTALARSDGDVDLERRAKLHVLLARASILVGDWVRADHDVAVAASMAAPPSVVRPEVEAVAAHVCLNLGRHADAVVHAEAAIDGALTASRPEIACEALEAIGRSTRFTDPVASCAAFARAIEIAADAGLAAMRLRALHETAVNEAFLDWRFDRLAVVRRDAEAMGAVLTLAVADLHDAGSLLIAGEVDGARLATMRCLDACRRYRFSMLPMVLVHLGTVAAFSGDRDAADAAVDEALALAPDDLDVRSQVAGWVDATFSLVAGDLDAWWDHLDRGMSIVGDSSATIPSPWRGQWALAAAVRGDDGPAERLRASHARLVAPNRAYLDMIDAVEHARAGRRADADRTFTAAADLLTGPRTDLLRHLGRVLVAPAAAELGWGDPASWLRGADAWSSDAGFDGLTSTIRATMRRLDVPVPRRGRGESEVPPGLRRLGVTSREMDVLVLLVDRCSNREIADRLHLSVRTVEKHVASLMSKTASRDRHALAVLAADPV